MTEHRGSHPAPYNHFGCHNPASDDEKPYNQQAYGTDNRGGALPLAGESSDSPYAALQRSRQTLNEESRSVDFPHSSKAFSHTQDGLDVSLQYAVHFHDNGRYHGGMYHGGAPSMSSQQSTMDEAVHDIAAAGPSREPAHHYLHNPLDGLVAQGSELYSVGSQGQSSGMECLDSMAPQQASQNPDQFGQDNSSSSYNEQYSTSHSYHGVESECSCNGPTHSNFSVSLRNPFEQMLTTSENPSWSSLNNRRIDAPQTKLTGERQLNGIAPSGFPNFLDDDPAITAWNDSNQTSEGTVTNGCEDNRRQEQSQLQEVLDSLHYASDTNSVNQLHDGIDRLDLRTESTESQAWFDFDGTGWDDNLDEPDDGQQHIQPTPAFPSWPDRTLPATTPGVPAMDEPLLCDVNGCTRTFSGRYSKGNRTRHKKTKHSASQDLKLTCEVCRRAYRRSDALLKHRRKKHPELDRVLVQHQMSETRNRRNETLRGFGQWA